MKQVILNDEEQNDLSSALEQVGDLYEIKANELERNIEVAKSKVKDFRDSRQTITELRTKVTLAQELPEELEPEVTDEPTPPTAEDFTPTHTICMCDICVFKRNSIITDDSIEQME